MLKEMSDVLRTGKSVDYMTSCAGHVENIRLSLRVHWKLDVQTEPIYTNPPLRLNYAVMDDTAFLYPNLHREMIKHFGTDMWVQDEPKLIGFRFTIKPSNPA